MTLSNPRSMLVSLAEEKMLRRLRQIANQYAPSTCSVDYVIVRLVTLEPVGQTRVITPMELENTIPIDALETKGV